MKLFVKSDWNGFFGLFTNNLTNILVMATLLTVVVGLPGDMVYGMILPAVGFIILVSAGYYTYMAYRLAKKEQRNDVTTMPAGTSVPHMFLIVFMVIGPVYWATNDPYLAWGAGLVWALFEGIIELLGVVVGPFLKKYVPRAALLGSLAGVSITYISLNPAYGIFAIPYIGLVTLAIVLLGWIGKAKMPFGLPVGLVAIIVGVVIGWASGLMTFDALTSSFANLTFSIPIPRIQPFIDGFDQALPFLVAAIPLGIYNFFEDMDNIESAEVAGDQYDTKEVMLADGITTIVGALFGSPFPTAVFIGHAGWKTTGARLGYSLMSGIGIFILTLTGLISVLLTVIPVVAILPILIYIGIIISTQAFSEVDKKYAPAVVLAIIPALADWTTNAVNIAFSSAGTDAGTVGYDVIDQAGLNYLGMSSLGAGSIVIGMILAAIAVYIIDKKYLHAAIASGAAAALSFFGIIHAAQVAINANLGMTLGYLAISLIFLGYMYFENKKEKEINETVSS